MNQSTTVPAETNFFDIQPGVRALRWVLAGVEWLCPAVAVHAAYRLMRTPLPFFKTRWLTAQANGWKVEQWPFEDAEITVYTVEVPPNPPCPPVLLLHGWGGHALDMLPLADALAERGFRPILVDLPAHGCSRGRVTNLAQFARAIEYITAPLEAKGECWTAVVAHSLGACAAAHAAGRGLATQKLVMLAPPASPQELTRLFARVLGLSERTRTLIQQRIEAREGMLMRQFEPSAVGPRIKQPTLIVHDRGDRINNFADAEAFRDHILGAQLLATDGLGHRKILRHAGVLQAVGDFIAGGSKSACSDGVTLPRVASTHEER